MNLARAACAAVGVLGHGLGPLVPQIRVTRPDQAENAMELEQAVARDRGPGVAFLRELEKEKALIGRR
jgi:hypothetical protein